MNRSGPNIVVFDIETGGLSAEKSPLVEVYFACYDTITGEKVSSYESLISPYYKHPKTGEELKYTDAAMRVHGISITELEIKGKELKVVGKEVVDYLKNCKLPGRNGKPILVGHNIISFDIPYTDTHFGWHNINWLNEVSPFRLDTLDMSRIIWPQTAKDDPKSPVKDHKLGTCCAAMGVNVSNAHRAADDVDGNAKMAIEMINRMRGKNATVVQKNDLTPGKPYKF
jgi:DNA polymerase III alpha subunit (gram-positive type)